MSIFKKIFSREKKEKLDDGLKKSKDNVWGKIAHAVAGKSKVDDEVLDNLEEALITSDVGVETTIKIIERLQARVARDKYVGTNELNSLLTEEIVAMLANEQKDILPGGADEDFHLDRRSDNPYVIMVVGVNGVGKTTTIGKLANRYKNAGYKVVLGAADTYRAAAIEQLEIWANRNDVDIIKQKLGSDPASVAFDALASAKAKGADVVIIDTAGRLHNKKGLMDELTKIRNTMRKIVPDAPDEILLVIDGSTGQNAYEQVKAFKEATDVNCLAVTKLDGTAKGGVVIGISDQFQVPIKYIGIGEGIDDLQIFNPEEFVRSLFMNKD